MGWLIAAIIIALFLCSRVSVRIGAGDDMNLWAGFGFLKFRILPTKEKTVKLRNYTYKRFKKTHPPEPSEEELAAAEKKSAAAKKAKDDKKALAKRRKNTELRLGEREKTDIPALIKKLTRVLKVFIARFGKHLRIELRELVLIIATGDAAQTAILYGAAIGAVQDLLVLLDATGTLKMRRDSRILVDTDFTSEKPTIRVDLTVSFRVWQIFDMGLRAVFEFLKNDKN